MTENAAIRMLTDEHEVILKVVSSLGRIADSLRAGGKADADLLREGVRFMREFADQRHHAKEEDLLFPAMERKGVPAEGGPIGVMNSEHVDARAHVAAFADAVEAYARDGAAAAEPVCAAIYGIGGLYPDHIWKEDNVLYPMALEVFSPEELNELLLQFEDVEAETGADMRAYFVDVAERLEAAAG